MATKTKIRDETRTILEIMLKDYPDIPLAIEKELNTINTPYADYEGDPIVITKSIRLINRLREQKEIIEKTLNEAPEWIPELINLMYFKSDPLPLYKASRALGYHPTTAKKYHDILFMELAQTLGISTINP